MDTNKLSDAKLLRYIGRIAIIFCEMEDEIELGIARELHDDCDEIGYMITCKMNFQQKIDLYERLVSHRLLCCEEPKRLKEFEQFIGEIKDIQNFRNNVIHNIRFNDDGEMFLRQRHKKKLLTAKDEVDEMRLPYRGMNSRFPKYKKIELNETMLKKFIGRIEKACDRISDWEMSA